MQLACTRFKCCLIVLAHPGFDDGDGVVVANKHTAQRVHICGALTGVEETSGEMLCVCERDRKRKSEFWKPSQHQAEPKLKRKSQPLSGPLEDDSTVRTIYETDRVAPCYSALYQWCSNQLNMGKFS